MLPIQIVLSIAATVLLSGAGGYFAGHWLGDSEGYQRGAADVQRGFDAFKRTQREAADRALVQRMDEEQSLRRQAREKTDALTKEVQSRDAALARTRRERDRLLVALAARPAGGGDAAAAPAGPQADGDAVGRALGECSGQLVEMGGLADRLSLQVIGLQDYARTAMRVCGGDP